MQKFLMNEFQEKKLSTKEEFDSFLNFRKENDEWKQVFLKDVHILGVANEPLFQQGEELEVSYTRNDNPCQMTLALSPENVFAIREGLGMFLTVPIAKMDPVPVSYTGYSTLLQRAGINGPVMNTFKSTEKKRALSHTKKQNILNDCFGLHTPDSKTWGWVLFRDGRIPAFNSSAYGILNVWELCHALEEKMAEEHPDFVFKDAQVNEEFTVVHYLLNDELANDSFTNLMKSFGLDLEKVELGMGLSTSDVGLSEAFVYPIIYVDGKEMRIGRGVGTKHDSCNTVATFEQNIKGIGSVFDECEDQIEKLGNTDIANVAVTMNLIANENPALFPKEWVELKRKEIRGSGMVEGTAMDVYLALYSIIEGYIKAKQPSFNRRIQLLEQVSRYLFFDYKKYAK